MVRTPLGDSWVEKYKKCSLGIFSALICVINAPKGRPRNGRAFGPLDRIMEPSLHCSRFFKYYFPTVF